MPHFLYKMFARFIFMCTFANAMRGKGNKPKIELFEVTYNSNQ